MTYVGSIDFYDGDFEIKTVEAADIAEAEHRFRRYVVTTFGRHIHEIDHISIQSLSYVSRKLAEIDKK